MQAQWHLSLFPNPQYLHSLANLDLKRFQPKPQYQVVALKYRKSLLSRVSKMAVNLLHKLKVHLFEYVQDQLHSLALAGQLTLAQV
ncbi:hypothetical protein D3C79_1024830 [compost metagenome]